MHQPIEEGAVGEDHRLGADLHAQPCFDPDAATLLDKDPHHAVLPKIQVGGALEHLSPSLGKQVAVVLRSGAPHGWSLGLVEHAELDGASVGNESGIAAEGVHLTHDLAFGDTPHGGVARHLSYDPHVHGDEQGGGSKVRGSCGGFVAGVACTHDDDIVRLNHEGKGREDVR